MYVKKQFCMREADLIFLRRYNYHRNSNSKEQNYCSKTKGFTFLRRNNACVLECHSRQSTTLET